LASTFMFLHRSVSAFSSSFIVLHASPGVHLTRFIYGMTKTFQDKWRIRRHSKYFLTA
jgi:hypothetical protein